MAESRGRYTIGIDVGGTFTDILCYDRQERKFQAAKVPSYPGQQWRGVLEAISRVGIPHEEIDAFVHGTTIATNAVLELTGAKTALITTEGFRDVIEIGRTQRVVGGLFDIKFKRSPPLVERKLRLEVPERTTADGTVERGIEEYDFGQIAEKLRAEKVEAVAVCFLNSYLNDSNERIAARKLQALLPGIPITCSATLVRERREYERFSTATINAYLTPVVVSYLASLTGELRNAQITSSVSIMNSNGGVMSLDWAAEHAAGTFLSGPVGGVIGAVSACRRGDIPNCITFDMGGTSTDVALIANLEPRTSYSNRIGAYPLLMPQLDIHTIGAGGGSVTWMNAEGSVEVGPRSAGALPGPACYGRGGTEPTISDANLLLGRLSGTRPLGGTLKLDRDAAEAAFAGLCARLGLPASETLRLAGGALELASAKMSGAVREVSVHRGFDPQDFVLLAFGGAGAMHVMFVAEQLGIGTVAVPRFPGHVSALGQLLASHRYDFARPVDAKLGEETLAEMEVSKGEVEREASEILSRDGHAEANRTSAYFVDIRYVGQSFTLLTPWKAGDTAGSLRARFDDLHRKTFGFSDDANDVQVVGLRATVYGIKDQPDLTYAPDLSSEPLIERRPVWFDGGWRDTPVYARESLPVSAEIVGPAIFEEAGGTTVMPPRWRGRVHASGLLLCQYE